MATERREYEVHDFDAIELRWAGDLVVEQGGGERVAAEGDAEVLEKLSVRVDDRRLILEMGQDWFERFMEGLRSMGRQPLTFHVGVATLERLAISGRGNVRCDSLTADALDLSVSGRGNVRIHDLQARELHVRIAGRGEVDIGGRAEEARLDIAGSGEVELAALEAARAEVRISGHGECELRVSDDLDVSISGFGRVRYHGDPHIRQTIAGAGSVQRLGD